jgi:hypothetical protein
VRDDAHRVEQLAAEQFEAHDAALRIVRAELLQEVEVVREPQGGIASEDGFDLLDALDDRDACAAAALVGLDERGEGEALEATQRLRIVEHDRARAVDAERAQERVLRALGELEREDVGAVDHLGAARAQVPEQREVERHGARIAAHVGARARLVEVEASSGLVEIAEVRALEIEDVEGDASLAQLGEERLLPLGVLVDDDQVRRAHRGEVSTGSPGE